MSQQHCALTRRWKASKVFVNNSFLVAKPTKKSIVLEKSTTDVTGFYRLTSQISYENHHWYSLSETSNTFSTHFIKKPINCWKTAE